MKPLTLLSAWAFMASIVMPSALASSAYTCTVFKYGSAIFTRPTGINNKGQVVGAWTNDVYTGQPNFHEVLHAFLRNADGTTTTLTSPSGSDEFTPAGINNLGQIAGPSFILNSDGSYIDIPPAVAPPGHTYESTTITGINDKGELTGTIMADPVFDGGTILVFIRGTDGQYRIIDHAGFGAPYVSLIAGDINNSDVVIVHTRYTDGYLLQPNGSKIPLLFPGLPFDSGSPGGSTSTRGLNNNNVTAGVTLSNRAFNVAFVRTPDGHYPYISCLETMNTSFFVLGINDRNVVLGSFYQSSPSGSGSELVGLIATPTGILPQAKVSHRSWAFDSHPIGETSGLGRIFISNSGPADLHIGSLYVGDTRQASDRVNSFHVTNSNCAPVPDGPPNLPFIPPGGWCFVDFRFTPEAPRWQTASIYIPTDSPDSPLMIRLGGIGIGSPLRLSNTSWRFDAHRVYTTSGKGVIYAYNPGPERITLRAQIVPEQGSSDSFHLLSDTCSDALAPYRACALTFNFTPYVSGENTASLDLNDNSEQGPIQIPLSGFAY
jgi:hypothetical protein